MELRGVTVRLTGIDTPEVGECGYGSASRFTAAFLERDNVRIGRRDGTDKYGRTLAYIRAGRTDLGTLLIKKGLANARYDSKDGYDYHPLQSRYRFMDSRVDHVCGKAADRTRPKPTASRGGGGGGGAGGYANCSEAPGPVYRGDPGYAPHLDADGDGVGCESS